MQIIPCLQCQSKVNHYFIRNFIFVTIRDYFQKNKVYKQR
ncbi:hypothetical protein GJA_1384 [Janthinobacterium agaricidamnosum NBRC 102515 = DSM 9628]|uniref:Uncharacterized protein n=1 Tax=Janthinobacterium agaricidamnosum NBRC 102515 = DSM 9628 TaxID=1349767 RepID=W0V456_9BURK|nr:hypothetical protein GJA_1384 [Janthinobacterium agaricidamnosum NBRC 102515 = DSM 9628]